MVHFDIAKLKAELEILEKEIAKPDFWEDTKSTTVVLQKVKSIKSKISLYDKIKKEHSDLVEMLELIQLELLENE